VLDLSGSRVRYGNAACLPPGVRPAVLAMPNSRMGFGRGARRPAPRRACAVPGPPLCIAGGRACAVASKAGLPPGLSWHPMQSCAPRSVSHLPQRWKPSAGSPGRCARGSDIAWADVLPGAA